MTDALAPGARAASRRARPNRIPERRPRLGFLGLGWIGRSRMEALARSGAAEVAALADPDAGSLEAAAALAPDARLAESLPGLLSLDLDGVVIATPSAQHAAQARAVLDAGLAAFCQKPLARTLAEHRSVIEAARRADRLLGVDLSYRHTRAARAVRRLVRAGTLGRVYALDLVFHNAYGPEKPWFYRPAESGGGCLMDLGTHLFDLIFWLTGHEDFRSLSGTLLAGGQPLAPVWDQVEDYAAATLVTSGGVHARIACSWKLPAGRDALISAHVYGTQGGAAFRNVRGSFYDFVAERFAGTARERLVGPPDAWGGRALTAWARRLARGSGYDPGVESLLPVARALDELYGR
jgi:predicted dehydrogenase